MDLVLNVGLTLENGEPKYTTTIKHTKPGTYPVCLVLGDTLEESVEHATEMLEADGHNIVAVNHIEY